MECNRFREQIEAFLFGEIDEAGQERFQTHLEACSDCRAAFEDQMHVHRALMADAPEPPAGLVDAVMGRVSEARRPVRRVPAFRWAIAAMLAVTLVGGMIIFHLTDIGAARDKVAEVITFDRRALSRESMVERIETLREVKITEVPGATVGLVSDLAGDSWTAVRTIDLPFGTGSLIGLLLAGLAAGVLNAVFIGEARRRRTPAPGGRTGKGGAA